MSLPQGRTAARRVSQDPQGGFIAAISAKLDGRRSSNNFNATPSGSESSAIPVSRGADVSGAEVTQFALPREVQLHSLSSSRSLLSLSHYTILINRRYPMLETTSYILMSLYYRCDSMVSAPTTFYCYIQLKVNLLV